MAAYIIRRLMLLIPTFIGVMLVSFIVVQFAPGGPVERIIATLSGSGSGADSRVPGSQTGDFGAQGQLQGGSQLAGITSKYRAARGLDPAFLKSLEEQFDLYNPASYRLRNIMLIYPRFYFC